MCILNFDLIILQSSNFKTWLLSFAQHIGIKINNSPNCSIAVNVKSYHFLLNMKTPIKPVLGVKLPIQTLYHHKKPKCYALLGWKFHVHHSHIDMQFRFAIPVLLQVSWNTNYKVSSTQIECNFIMNMQPLTVTSEAHTLPSNYENRQQRSSSFSSHPFTGGDLLIHCG